MSERVYLFDNGTQWADWSLNNCERCVKSVNTWDKTCAAWPTCELEAAIMESDIDDGSFAPEIARRIQAPEYSKDYIWPCGEVEWTEEWKAEYTARKAQQETSHVE